VVDTTGGKERVAEPPIVTIQNPEQFVRSEAFYISLSESEMHKLPISTVNKIGKHFVDSTDAPMIVEGTITAICREKKSRSLCFKYYDTTQYSSAPRDKTKYLYIVAKWALANVKFSSSKSALQCLAYSVINEEHLLNNGPGPRTKRSIVGANPIAIGHRLSGISY